MEILSSSALTTKGVVDTPAFNRLSQAQKDQAFIMKQQRLLREEKAAEVGRNKKEKKGGNGKGKANEEWLHRQFLRYVSFYHLAPLGPRSISFAYPRRGRC